MPQIHTDETPIERNELPFIRENPCSSVAKSPPQFRSIEIVRVVKRAVPRNQFTENEAVAAAELALKAHVLAFDPEMIAEMTDGDRTMQEMAEAVDLTEAPEDAICGLVIDLMEYCEREKIDWTEDVMSRAREYSRRERAYEVQKQ